MDRYGRGRKYIDGQNKKILEKMISYNKIQKYYVNCINNICDKTFKSEVNYVDGEKIRINNYKLTR